MLSSTKEHSDRWPITRKEVAALITDEEDPDTAYYSTSSYAHGVATQARARLGLPDVPGGAPVICLDIETIRERADEAGVHPTAMLLRVAAHELSHVLRGHTRAELGATHGWHKEGDAQRDAWQVLALLLEDPQFEALARAGRRAQIHLSVSQPPAYQQFGRLSPDRFDYSARDERQSWTIGAEGPLHMALRHEVGEFPVPRGPSVPRVGDEIWLETEDGTLGPFFCLGQADEPTRTAARLRHSAAEPVSWLHLSRGESLHRQPRSGWVKDAVQELARARREELLAAPVQTVDSLTVELRALRLERLNADRDSMRELWSDEQLSAEVASFLESDIDPDN